MGNEEGLFVKYILSFLAGVTPAVAIIIILLWYPEKIEKWSALLWKLLDKCGGLFKSAHKRYLKHDLQGRVNDFVKSLRDKVRSVENIKLRIEWIDPSVQRKSFIESDTLVLRLRRDDPADRNFVHGAYLFVSTMLLRKCKRYLSLSQGDAVDLYVCSKLFLQEKPTCVEIFMDEYLHPKTDGSKSKVALYVDDFAIIDSGKLFFPVFIQELEYLGDKVFGRRKDDIVISEVNGLINFLKPIATRMVGDDAGDLTFEGQYCRFGIVIVGKSYKLLTSIEPYIKYIRNTLAPKDAETIYVLAKSENTERVREICARLSPDYTCQLELLFKRMLHFRDRKEIALTYLAILRKRGVLMVQPSQQPGRANLR